MTVGIIGAGAIASALALRFAAAGQAVTISNSRGPHTLTAHASRLGFQVAAGTVQEAAASEFVVLAVPWRSAPDALAGVSDWSGRILIDTTNPLGPPDFRVADLGGRPSTSVIADMVPGAAVVKAFNTLPPAVLAEDPRHSGGRRVIFLSGDDAVTNKRVQRLVEGAGWAVIDLGSLHLGGRLQQFPGGVLPTLDLALR
ncbi:NAD(P)-binding domain-containing protein [Kineococcus gypseus]